MKQTSCPVSVYIHIPFCRTRCFYCDFNTFAGKDPLIPDYVQALCGEITRQKPFEENTVHSLYFGGGTPSRLSPEAVSRIMDAVRGTFRLTGDAEITFEMNPCDVTAEYAGALAGLGINRISLGMQSAVPEELKCMGRRHSAEQVVDAVGILRKARIRNLSLDLIYGYPLQTIESWKVTLDAALVLEPEHVSLYALSVEEGSALSRQIAAGKYTLPDEDLTVEMYDLAAETLADAGFRHYEVSNWAREKNYESRHNKPYWFVRPYYGFGAGAHGWIDHQRIRNAGAIADYIRMVESSNERFPAAAEMIPQDRYTEMQDCMMLGLRMLDEGITEDRFRERFGTEMRNVFARELRHLERKGLVRWEEGGRLLLREDKVMVANQAFMEFVC